MIAGTSERWFGVVQLRRPRWKIVYPLIRIKAAL
jgi:hypothetical protein